jgi:hypothetical protein
MKKIISLLLITTFLACCNKDDNPIPTNPVNQLPPATQTGANTFGCLLDGEVFKPGLTNNSYNCFYQLVDGEYFFVVGASNQKNGILKSITIGTEKKSISLGETLNLFERINGNAYGAYYRGNSNTGTDELLYTSQINTGELKITKLDFTNNIVSGTFWFDVKDNKGVIHQIRNGRFDMQFTQ